MDLNIYLIFKTDKKKKKALIELPLVYLFTPFEHTPQINARGQSQHGLWAKSQLLPTGRMEPYLVTAWTDAAADFLKVTICSGISNFIYLTAQFNLFLIFERCRNSRKGELIHWKEVHVSASAPSSRNDQD